MKKLGIVELLLALCLLAFPVSAAQTGSLVIQNVENPAVIYHVADADGELTQDFAGAMPEKLTEKTITAENAKGLQGYARQKAISGQTGAPDAEGNILFPALAEGCYLICSTASKGEFAPFLIRVPMTINGKTVYDIQAEPKADTTPDPSTPTSPEQSKPNIPQTGSIQWPKYLLLVLGAAAVVAGVYEVLRGGEKHYE